MHFAIGLSPFYHPSTYHHTILRPCADNYCHSVLCQPTTMFLVLFVLLQTFLLLTCATPLLYPRDNQTIVVDASQTIACTTGNINIDPSYPLSYVDQWCSMVSASTPDWLIKVTGLPQGTVDMLYAWEAAGDNFDQTCSTACVNVYQAMIPECECSSCPECGQTPWLVKSHNPYNRLFHMVSVRSERSLVLTLDSGEYDSHNINGEATYTEACGQWILQINPEPTSS